MKAIVNSDKETHNGRCRLSKEELSRILSAHEAGQLAPMGSYQFAWNRGCLFQVALNEPESSVPVLYRRLASRAGTKTIRRIVRSFDDQYMASWTPSRLIKFLIKHGLA